MLSRLKDDVAALKRERDIDQKFSRHHRDLARLKEEPLKEDKKI